MDNPINARTDERAAMHAQLQAMIRHELEDMAQQQVQFSPPMSKTRLANKVFRCRKSTMDLILAAMEKQGRAYRTANRWCVDVASIPRDTREKNLPPVTNSNKRDN